MSCLKFKPVDESYHFSWMYDFFQECYHFPKHSRISSFKIFNKLSLFHKSHENINLFLVQIDFTSSFIINFINFILF